MQLKMQASPKSPNASASSSSPSSTSKVDEDDFNDDYDDDIDDPESLNRTLSEIIEGKRSSTSLIAILNREYSDCDSVKSSESEASGSGPRVTKSNSFKGSGMGDGDRLTCVEESGATDIKSNANQLSKPSNISDDSAINQSRLDYVSQSKTGLQSCEQRNGNDSAISDNQSKGKNKTLMNGELAPEMLAKVDVNENIHLKGVKHKDSNTLHGTLDTDINV